MIKKIVLVLLAILIVIQFIRPARNVAQGDQPNNIAKVYEVPADVKTILAKACLDCHSNNTRYLWYFKIQPVDWWLTSHINDGKEELNFDEFADKPIRYKYHKLQAVTDQIKKGEMPINSYLWIHKDAVLTDQEKNTLTNWADAITNDIKSKYPPDSLARKKQ
jgi:Haem-binding domain